MQINTMKKTITMAALSLALTASAFAESYTFASDTTQNLNYNTNMHGFYFTLASDHLTASTTTTLAPENIRGSYTLNSFTFRTRNDGNNSVSYGFIVVDDNNTILGKSNANAAATNTDLTFTFTDATGSTLSLDATTSYRFLSVTSATLELVTATGMSYSSSNDTVNLNGSSISGGLAISQIRGHSPSNEDFALISGANGLNTSEQSAVFSSIAVSDIDLTKVVPEPTTATLSLLALAGLAARRRRK